METAGRRHRRTMRFVSFSEQLNYDTVELWQTDRRTDRYLIYPSSSRFGSLFAGTAVQHVMRARHSCHRDNDNDFVNKKVQLSLTTGAMLPQAFRGLSKNIRYDIIRYDTKEDLNVDSKLSDQLSLAHVATKKYEKEETKTNKRQFLLSSVQV